MAELGSPSTQQLFKQWRSGDANSGAAMAQRFSDWYYAVTVVRLGDTQGRVPLQRACMRFQQGIVSVTNAADLADWAHGLLAEELEQAGGRITGGDFGNVLTGGRAASQLLARAATALPPEQVVLLAHAYDASVPIEVVAQEAEALGGMPLAVLQARLTLKRWLRDNLNVAFTEVPDKPNLDCAPLPLYEAARMTTPADETGFEKWLLSDMALCKDVAEFGVFALALRAGAFKAQKRVPTNPVPKSETAPTPATSTTPPASPRPTPRPRPPAPSQPSLGPYLVIGVVLLLLGAVAAAAVMASLADG